MLSNASSATVSDLRKSANTSQSQSACTVKDKHTSSSTLNPKVMPLHSICNTASLSVQSQSVSTMFPSQSLGRKYSNTQSSHRNVVVPTNSTSLQSKLPTKV